MKKRKNLLLVVNPRAGKERIKNHLLEIVDLFVKAGYEVRVHITQEARDASRVVAESAGAYDRIVCSGGDGTLNEVVSGLMASGKRPLLGYIPAGSTNDFAASLKLPRNMPAAARGAVEGELFPVDVGRFCGDRYFLYVAGFGAFTEVSYLTSQDKKNLLGHQAYVIEGVKSLTSIKSYHMRVWSEEIFLEGDFIFGMVTNTVRVGGFKGLLDKHVSLNDGWFEALFIRIPRTPLEFSEIVSDLVLKEEKSGMVHKFCTRTLRLEAEECVDWVLDGEFGGSRTEAVIENMQGEIGIVKMCGSPDRPGRLIGTDRKGV